MSSHNKTSIIITKLAFSSTNENQWVNFDHKLPIAGWLAGSLLLTEKAVERVEHILVLAVGLVLNEARSILDHLAEFVTPLYACK